MADYFPKDSVIRRVNAEPAILFGAGRALLLQLAHPAVAQGVADHSDFQHNPFKRLWGTVESTYAVVFGSDELARAVGQRIQRIHDHVTGPTYEANDPPNLLWVHATLLDSALQAYTRLVGPLSPADEAAYYRDMTRVGEVFGLSSADQPATIADFRAYFDMTVDTIEITDTGRRLGVDIIRPPLPSLIRIVLAPSIAVHRLVAVGTTPEPLRKQFGFAWGERKQRRLGWVESLARTLFRITPRPLRVAGPWIVGRVLLCRAGRRTMRKPARQPSG